MKPFPLLGLLAVVACLSGCASDKNNAPKPIALAPTMISQSYDYTSPDNIARQDQAVWVLPVKNTGWQKGGVGADGSWYSGQYRSYIVKPGYWSSQEQAQMSGRPYLVNNQTVIPSPAPDGAPSTNPGATELDMTKDNARLDALEQGQAHDQATTTDPDAQAASAAREQALAVLASPQVKTSVDSDPGEETDSDAPQISVPASHHHKKKMADAGDGTMSATPPVPGARMAKIHYTSDTTGSVIVDGKSYPFTLQYPGQKVTIQIPDDGTQK